MLNEETNEQMNKHAAFRLMVEHIDDTQQKRSSNKVYTYVGPLNAEIHFKRSFYLGQYDQ